MKNGHKEDLFWKFREETAVQQSFSGFRSFEIRPSGWTIRPSGLSKISCRQFFTFYLVHTYLNSVLTFFKPIPVDFSHQACICFNFSLSLLFSLKSLVPSSFKVSFGCVLQPESINLYLGQSPARPSLQPLRFGLSDPRILLKLGILKAIYLL